MSIRDESLIGQVESARQALAGVVETSGESRHAAAGEAVRAVTRLWCELNPGFDLQAFNAVSWMIGENWDQIVTHRYIGGVSNRGETDEQLLPEPSTATAAELRVLCSQLSAEPLFGARELIHSNLLAWFIDHVPEVRRLIAEWTAEADTQASPTERERYKFDLLVHLEGRAPLVIENKTFSLPDEAQLAKYSETAAMALDPQPWFVLLSLADPRWPGREQWVGEHLWRYVSYATLGQALEHASSLIDNQGQPDAAYRSETLRRFGRLLLALHTIAQLVTNLDHTSTYLLPPEEAIELDRVRLAASYSKLRTHRVAQILNDTRSDAVIGGFTRDEPLLERFTVTGRGDEMGWQLQGRKWRLAVRVAESHPAHGSGAANAEARAEYVAKHYRGFFDLNALGLTDVSTKHEWLRFAPDFVYRYGLIPADTTVGQLADLAAATDQLAAPFSTL